MIPVTAHKPNEETLQQMRNDVSRNEEVFKNILMDIKFKKEYIKKASIDEIFDEFVNNEGYGATQISSYHLGPYINNDGVKKLAENEASINLKHGDTTFAKYKILENNAVERINASRALW